MLRTVLISVIVLTLFSCNLAERRSRNSRHKKIIAGSLAELNEIPYQVSVAKEDREFNCGGSLIHPNFIVTAAHCNRPGWIVAGDSDSFTNSTTEARQERRITEFISHPRFRFPYNDIAVIFVQHPFEIVPGVVETIPLSNDLEYPTGEIIVSGWGRTIGPDSSSVSRFLMKNTLEAVTFDYCDERMGLHPALPIFCYASASSQRNICRGDSGGPIVQDVAGVRTLIGVISSVSDDCSTEDPSGGMPVAHFLDWIHETMEEMFEKYSSEDD